MSALDFLKESQKYLQLNQIQIRDLYFLEKSPCRLYFLKQGVFSPIISEGKIFDKEIMNNLNLVSDGKLFCDEQDYGKLIELQNQNLRLATRSLSMGEPIVKGKRQIALLSINLRYLYQNTTSDEQLQLIYQSGQTLCQFVLGKPEIAAQLYRELHAQNFYYIYSQPILSSLMLLGFLKETRLFNDKDIEQLFLTALVKDIGMSAVPKEISNSQDLSISDIEVLRRHTEHSCTILHGRVNLPQHCFNIIEHHHDFSELSTVIPEEADEDVKGIECLLVNMTDILTAMTTARPYRSPSTYFEALELVKSIMANDYPLEFKMLVKYFSTLK